MCKPHLIILSLILNFHIVHISAQNTNILRIRRQIDDSGFCKLPDFPTFGKWRVYNPTDSVLSPGEYIPPDSILIIECDEGYQLDSVSITLCKSGKWTVPVGTCLKVCPSILRTNLMSANCTLNQEIKNCDHPVENTIASFTCADYHEFDVLDFSVPRTCRNGVWRPKIPNCRLKCGYKSRDPTLIVGGNETFPNEYPWQVALYRKGDKRPVCGGSLINQKVILTAAHCLADSKGQANQPNLYTVAVGKHFAKIDDPRDQSVSQFSSVEKIFIAEGYRGDFQNYYGDVAIIIAKKSFELSSRVLPVCVDWDLKYKNTLQDGSGKTTGFVAGWGFTFEYKERAKMLKHLQVPIIPLSQCEKNILEEDRKLLTHDKICAGYLNSSSSTCQGDSGGGLVFKFEERYFIVGIVSTSLLGSSGGGGCNSQQYSSFTNVYNYVSDFISGKEQLYRPKPIVSTSTSPITVDKKCTLPDGNLFYFQSLTDESKIFLSGMRVPSGQTLKVSCLEGFGLDGAQVTTCMRKRWSSKIGHCLKTCPPIKPAASTTASCSLRGEYFSCSTPIEGTQATYKCASFYESLAYPGSVVSVCRNGVWTGQAILNCVAGCGIGTRSSSGSGKVKLNQAYPWHVGLYNKRNLRYVCGGTLISENAVLTAAVCITQNGIINSKSDYMVAVGKYYKSYNDPRDHDAQFSEVKNMLVHPEFKGASGNFLNDVGFVIVSKKFKLTLTVSPACVDWRSKYDNDSINPFTSFDIKYTGYASGWENFSEELKEIKILTQNLRNCYKFDFFVANSRNDQSTVVPKMCTIDKVANGCLQHTGEGLVFKLDGKYYVSAVIGSPLEPGDGECNTLSQLSPYLSFISKIKTY